MKIYIVNLFFVLVYSVALFAQANIDSLEVVLSHFDGTDKEKVELLNEIAKEYRGVSPDKTIEYGKQALTLAQKEKDRNGEANSLNNIGAGNFFLGNYDKSLEYFLQSLEIKQEFSDKENIAGSFNNIGTIYLVLCDYNKALEYYLKSYKMYEDIGDTVNISKPLNNLGSIYLRINDYDKALEYCLKSLEVMEKIGDDKNIAGSLNNIGNIHLALCDNSKALEYYLKSLKITERIGDKLSVAASLNNVGSIYLKLGNYSKALEYYSNSMNIEKETGDKRGISETFNNIGSVYEKTGSYNEALEYYFKSLKIKKEIGDKMGIANSQYNIGNIYKQLKNYNKAYLYIEQVLKFAKEVEDKYLLQECYRLLSDLYSVKGDHKKSLEYYKMYADIKDSIFTKESSEKIAEMQTKYETEKKERENELLRRDNEIQKSEIARQEYVRDSLIVMSGLILILALIIYSRYRVKQKANKILNEKNIQITEQKNHLSTTLAKLQESNKIIEEKTKELKKSEKQYRTLYQSAEDAIFIIRKDVFIDCNPAAEAMFGCSRSDIINRSYYEFSPYLQPDSMESKEKALEKIKNALKGEHQFFEWVYCRPDGTTFETEVSLNRMKIDVENMVLAIVRNITERKLAERKLKESERRSTLLETEIINLHEKQTGTRRIIGESEPMLKMFTMIDKVAETDAAVLIYGETGTGKESVAHAIHSASFRKNKPLGIIDCGSIPAGLLESELFGHEKGAFTGAYSMKKGLFETSDGGTVFLDEISEIPFNLQSNLLRVLQEKDIRRVGETKRMNVNVRVIAASNKHLKPLVVAGKFREDLYYRLSVVPIEVPPLRERDDDIMLLAHYFLGQFGRKRNKIGFTNDAQKAINSYQWQGNVRELKHKIERAVILNDSGYISAKDLKLENISGNNNIVEYRTLILKNNEFNLKETVEKYEKDIIKEAFSISSKNQRQTAKRLKLRLSGLQYKLKKYNIS
ncbi:MAG: sigma 54-interacting transcriptional regulator [candidate division Zixibacteria bacterium]|nr:sigma 54-interacting transcriptional regulator [candidate division Zixibacteria bacterium]